MHAYGLAVDINPIENPWVRADKVSPAAGRAYLDRSLSAPGVIRAGDVVVRAFASIGWKWGEYAKANDLTLADTMWERYLTGPAEPDLSKHVTEAFWPLA